MQFPPKTEAEIAAENLLPEAIYPFTVADAEAKTSRAGNEMIELALRIHTPDGAERGLRDWLMPKMAYKLFHFCAYTGLSREYEAGNLCAADCRGRTGYAKIVIRKDKTGEFPDQNAVADYVRSADGKMNPAAGIATHQAPPPPPPKTENLDDDVPF